MLSYGQCYDNTGVEGGTGTGGTGTGGTGTGGTGTGGTGTGGTGTEGTGTGGTVQAPRSWFVPDDYLSLVMGLA